MANRLIANVEIIRERWGAANEALGVMQRFIAKAVDIMDGIESDMSPEDAQKILDVAQLQMNKIDLQATNDKVKSLKDAVLAEEPIS